jgi:hypothetical protein
MRRAQATLEKHLPLEADSYCCTSATLYEVLIGVAAQRSTIESVCAELAGAPDGETIRGYLNEQLRVEELAELERGGSMQRWRRCDQSGEVPDRHKLFRVQCPR